MLVLAWVGRAGGQKGPGGSLGSPSRPLAWPPGVVVCQRTYTPFDQHVGLATPSSAGDALWIVPDCLWHPSLLPPPPPPLLLQEEIAKICAECLPKDPYMVDIAVMDKVRSKVESW